MTTNPQENDEHSGEGTTNGGREVVQPSEEEPIEGGDITGLDEPLSAFNREKHEADTARRLSYLFVGVLAGMPPRLRLPCGWILGLKISSKTSTTLAFLYFPDWPVPQQPISLPDGTHELR